jgi:hypothetical protein
MSVSVDDRFRDLEQDLLRSLRPVKPNPEFVNHLGQRLLSPATTIVETRPAPSYSLGAVLVGTGLAVGLLVVWLIRQLR